MVFKLKDISSLVKADTVRQVITAIKLVKYNHCLLKRRDELTNKIVY